MARLKAQIKGGFYAADPIAVAAVMERLKPPGTGDAVILDPCAGEAHALLQLAEGLNATAYAIELSEDRAAVVRESLSEGQALAPADFLRCSISYGSFSFIWCNPPYDYATGGEGRVERQFIERAADLLVDGGVLALVCPEDVAGNHTMAEFFEERFSQISAMPFPEGVRKYNETVIFGCKRRKVRVVGYKECPWDWLDKRRQDSYIYRLPAGIRPTIFRKSEPTDTELARLVAQSPLRFLIEPPAERIGQRLRPPMSPGIGHRAMLLASGHIDGLISPSDEPPHVIRGTATKEEFVSSCDSSEDEDGNLTTKTVISEKPTLLIRVLDSTGEITDLE